MGITKAQINYVSERLDVIRRKKIRELDTLEFEKLSVEEKIGQIINGKASLKSYDDYDLGTCPLWLERVLDGFNFDGEDILLTKESIGRKEIEKAIKKLTDDKDNLLDEFVLSGTGSQEIIEKFKNLDYVSRIPHAIKNND